MSDHPTITRGPSGRVRRFLLWLAAVEGAWLDTAGLAPARRFYAALGAMVLATSIIAGLSMGVFVHSVVSSSWVAFGVGVAWMGVILLFERVLLASLTPDGSGRWAVFSRIGIAFVISFIVSQPLEASLFRDQIENARRETNEKLALLDREVRLQDSLAVVNEEMRKAKAQSVVGWKKAATLENDGHGPSGLRGQGPDYWAYMTAAGVDSVQAARYQILSERAASAESRARTKADSLRTQFGSALRGHGIAGDLIWLTEISRRDPWVATLRWVIVLLVICLDTLTVVLKATFRSPYSELVRRREKEFVDALARRDADVEARIERRRGARAARKALYEKLVAAVLARLEAQLHAMSEGVAAVWKDWLLREASAPLARPVASTSVQPRPESSRAVFPVEPRPSRRQPAWVNWLREYYGFTPSPAIVPQTAVSAKPAAPSPVLSPTSMPSGSPIDERNATANATVDSRGTLTTAYNRVFRAVIPQLQGVQSRADLAAATAELAHVVTSLNGDVAHASHQDRLLIPEWRRALQAILDSDHEADPRTVADAALRIFGHHAP